MCRESASRRAFLAAAALLFAISAAGTVVWCGSMSGAAGMPMPGGWVMSMAWMRMPGQTWAGAAASFVGMWAVMMVAMMLPSLTAMLSRYRQAVAPCGRRRLGALTAVAAGGYFLVWTALGAIAFPLGVALATLEMRLPSLARAAPVGEALIVLGAGWVQLTRWKARQLACCGGQPGSRARLPADLRAAWRHGLRLGVQCSRCCSGLTAVLLALGVMDMRVMVGVTAAITLERLAPAGPRIARLIGVAAVGAGLLLLAHAAGLA